jgi:hypothetical protein
MAVNVVGNRTGFLTVEVANAIMNYRAFMDANAGAYSYEGALRGPEVRADRRNAGIPGETRISGAHTRYT